MHDTLLVELADGDNDLSGVELDNALVEALLFLENLVEFTTVDEGHDEVETGFRLEKVVHSTEERMISLE